MDDPKAPTSAASDPKKPPGANKYVLRCTILASMNSILLGYDIGVMSGSVVLIKEYLGITYVQVQFLVGILNVCSLIGSLASGKTSDLIGRRYTVVVAAATFLIGALLMGLAPSYPYLVAGRVVAGIGVGYSLMIAPLYTAEIAPASVRGMLTSLPEFFIVAGILLGYVCNYALAGLPERFNWRLMLGMAGVPAVGLGSSVIFMPESPRWLVMKGRIEEAKRVLLKTSRDEEEAESRLQEINQAALDDANLASSKGRSGHAVWREFLHPSPALRRILITAIGMNFFMQASGNDAVIIYTPEVFRAAGIHNKKKLFGINVIMGCTKAAFVMVSALFLDRFGRRPLLLLGSVGMACSLAALGLGSTFLEHAGSKPVWAMVVSIVAVCADVSFFSIGLGPITWVYSSEVFPLRLRAQGTALAISVNRLMSGAVSMSFLSVSNRITFGGTFFVLCGVMVVASLFFYCFLPETKGKTLEEMGALFEDKREEGDEPKAKEMTQL
ncbi:probable polyol transporter 6 [Rhodamnia argentea]|uniref:Probable polyol transporter 6 n=1 Tax=Rhodamnia argentea TaxID=178133 RepID=A0A8B8Q3W5_9MYRT|nr:probable polyol transporter 6 [Rhodamnia argentea]